MIAVIKGQVLGEVAEKDPRNDAPRTRTIIYQDGQRQNVEVIRAGPPRGYKQMDPVELTVRAMATKTGFLFVTEYELR